MGSSNNTGLTDSSDIQKLEDADSCPFSIGEMVIAFHGHSFYAAKGWNKKWDEWVTTDRLMAYSEDNVRNHLAINKQQEIDKSMKLARSSNFKEKNANVFVSGKKRKNDDCLFRGNIHITMEMCAKIQIPLRLKKHLVDDCEFVTRMGKLPRLPRHPNVNEILHWYVQHRTKENDSSANSVQEIMKGLQCYFDKALPLRLLYKRERRQYERAMAAYDLPPSHVYGAEHLLRLFVMLPELLYHANIEEDALVELILQFNDFLKYLRENQRKWFRTGYYVADDTDTSADEQDDIV
ncbi:protein MRG1-like isoform X2 [Humulus lupulus]|uniref:protein MRG1-like isoform X2 n=1 Tax=Humulus lupulus TaxID=3486 RepID=UPI002B40FEDA|nr:protein MRG1-like isoform X2 [Humulus lupulus]